MTDEHSDLIDALAKAEYARVTAPARAEYKRVKAPAWDEYWRDRRRLQTLTGGSA